MIMLESEGFYLLPAPSFGRSLNVGVATAAGRYLEGYPNTVKSMIPLGAPSGQPVIVSFTKRHSTGSNSSKILFLETVLSVLSRTVVKFSPSIETSSLYL